MSAVPMSLCDENHPTQDTEIPATIPEAEVAPKGWGRLVSLHDKEMLPIYLTQDTVTFGRRSTCDVHIRHPAVSGVHCTLKNCGNEIVLTDESTNGTFVHGLAVGKGRQRKINDGDEIMLIKSASEKIGYKFHLNSEDRALNEAEEKYQFGKDLGSGAFAIVKRCTDKSTGVAYAVKIIDKKKFAMQNQTTRDALMDEHKILKKVNHRGVIKCHDMIDTPDTLYVVLDLVHGGDLFDRIIAQDGKGFSEEVARDMFGQMLDAISYLHSINIVHRDLKPENILLLSPSSNEIRISDFGLSRIIRDGSFMKTMCGTPQYLAPEVLNEHNGGLRAPKGYDKAVDVWSLGCILYILLSGLAPFSGTNMNEDIRLGRISFAPLVWKKVSDKAKELVRSLLTVDPKQRLTVEDAQKHAWMNPRGKRKESSSTMEISGSAEKKRALETN